MLRSRSDIPTLLKEETERNTPSHLEWNVSRVSQKSREFLTEGQLHSIEQYLADAK
jgi:hypothetical protein